MAANGLADIGAQYRALERVINKLGGRRPEVAPGQAMINYESQLEPLGDPAGPLEFAVGVAGGGHRGQPAAGELREAGRLRAGGNSRPAAEDARGRPGRGLRRPPDDSRPDHDLGRHRW